ncbi:MAG: DNA double-strand break repair nuclease NurA [Desulfurococcaceae archaeon]
MEINEEIHVGVAPEIIYTKIAELVDQVIENTSRYREIEELRKTLGPYIKKIHGSIETCSYAVDSSYSVPPIEIAGGYIGIVQVSEIIAGPRCNSSPIVKAYVEYHPVRDITGIKARLYEREHLIQALLKKKNNEAYFDLALVDGEILYRGGLDNEVIGVEERDIVNQTVNKTKITLQIASETNTPVIGVLKRSYSRDITVLHGHIGLNINDRLLMTMILEPGQYYVQGTYKEIYEKYRAILGERDQYGELSQEATWRIRSRFNWIEKLVITYFPEYKDKILVVYYKPFTPPGALAVKLEVYPTRSWDIEKIIKAVASQTGSTGFPMIIDYVDTLSYISVDVKRLVYSLLKSLISERDPKLAELVTKLMNPQKPI